MSELADGGREWKGSETQNETTLPLSYKLPCSTHKSHSARRLGSLEVVQFLSLLKIWRKFVWVGGFLMIPHIFHHFRLWKRAHSRNRRWKLWQKDFHLLITATRTSELDFAWKNKLYFSYFLAALRHFAVDCWRCWLRQERVYSIYTRMWEL